VSDSAGVVGVGTHVHWVVLLLLLLLVVVRAPFLVASPAFALALYLLTTRNRRVVDFYDKGSFGFVEGKRSPTRR
jgi:hypothetical protein